MNPASKSWPASVPRRLLFPAVRSGARTAQIGRAAVFFQKNPRTLVESTRSPGLLSVFFPKKPSNFTEINPPAPGSRRSSSRSPAPRLRLRRRRRSRPRPSPRRPSSCRPEPYLLSDCCTRSSSCAASRRARRSSLRPPPSPATRHETRRLDILASREPSTHPFHRMMPCSCNSSPCRQPLAATKASRRLLAAAELKDCCGRRTAVIQQDGDGGVPPPVHHLFPLAFQLGQPRRPLPLRFQQSRRTTAGLIPKLRPRLAVADSSRGRCAADAPALGAGGQASPASRLRHMERITKP